MIFKISSINNVFDQYFDDEIVCFLQSLNIKFDKSFNNKIHIKEDSTIYVKSLEDLLDIINNHDLQFIIQKNEDYDCKNFLDDNPKFELKILDR